MSTPNIETLNLELVLNSLEGTRARIEAMSPSDRAELSADWLALVDSATSAIPWVHGFAMVRRADNAIVGECGFKGPPSPDEVVEIAYGVDPKDQGKGYATEAAQALTSYAFKHDDVRVVRAHTRPESDASARVLTKCGFRQVGEVIDPGDGLVWRWEKHDEAA